MQRISNFAHQVEACVLAIAAGIALAQAAGYWIANWRRYLWPAFILIAGAFLLGFMLLPHHGLEHARDQWAFIFGDPQQRQHLALGGLALFAGAVEVLHRAGRLRGPAWQFVWPAAVAVVGLMFGLHTQHGTTEAVINAQLITDIWEFFLSPPDF